jgi:imidazoleglycerol-phosphate dehydratase/histidinol-phosphatase
MERLFGTRGYQLDSLDKLEFYPKHFSIWLKLQLSWITIGDGDQSRRIRNGYFRKIRPTQNFILRALKMKVYYSTIFFVDLFPEDNAPTQAKNGHVDKIY